MVVIFVLILSGVPSVYLAVFMIVYKREDDLGPYSVLVDTVQLVPVDALHRQSRRLVVAER